MLRGPVLHNITQPEGRYQGEEESGILWGAKLVFLFFFSEPVYVNIFSICMYLAKDTHAVYKPQSGKMCGH